MRFGRFFQLPVEKAVICTLFARSSYSILILLFCGNENRINHVTRGTGTTMTKKLATA